MGWSDSLTKMNDVFGGVVKGEIGLMGVCVGERGCGLWGIPTIRQRKETELIAELAKSRVVGREPK